MTKAISVGAVHTHTHTIQLNKIKKAERNTALFAIDNVGVAPLGEPNKRDR